MRAKILCRLDAEVKFQTVAISQLMNQMRFLINLIKDIRYSVEDVKEDLDHQDKEEDEGED